MTQFFPFMFLFSIGFGFCNGLTYMVPLQHGWLWFPEKPGLISGIIVGGFGIGTFALNLICLQIVNPDNIAADDDGKFPESVDKQVPVMLKTLVLVRLGMAVISCVMIFPGNDPTSEKQVKDTISRQPSMNILSRHDSNVN